MKYRRYREIIPQWWQYQRFHSINKQDFTNPCENTTSKIQIKTTIPQLDQGKELDASIRRSIALVNIAENYPPETWTHVYTDGSAIKAITDDGAGIIIQYPSGATQTASNFLYTQYMYFTLLNPNMSFNFNKMFVFGNSTSIR